MWNSKKTKQWQASQDIYENENITKYKILENNTILKFPEIFYLWKTSESFQTFYNNILANSKYAGFFWEIKPMNQDWENEDFEFVLVNSAALPRISADPKPFQEHFQTKESIITFPNLGRDAQLVVTSPISPKDNYPHFATFLRNAPDHQKNQLWKITSQEYQKKLNAQPQWLSTSGLGVYWLHLRIDTRPKYYQYRPYKMIHS